MKKGRKRESHVARSKMERSENEGGEVKKVKHTHTKKVMHKNVRERKKRD